MVCVVTFFSPISLTSSGVRYTGTVPDSLCKPRRTTIAVLHGNNGAH
jgi:hypothetical protein